MSKQFFGSLFFLVSLLLVFAGQAFGAELNSEYLKYQEPQSSSSSLFSTMAYLFFLVLIFVLVIGLAYFTSKFLGQKMMNTANDNKVLTVLSLGSSRAVYVVEIAGRILVLGVTDHTINLLQEITDPVAIEQLKNQSHYPGTNQFDAVFQKQLVSLQQMSRKFPAVFGSNRHGSDRSEDSEKR